MTSLELTLLYLFAAVLGVVVFRSLKLPPMLGYLTVGVVIGPNALAVAEKSESITLLGEFGVVFLMFVIGLEFSLSKLHAMRRHVFGLGLAQVLLTLLIAPALSIGFTLLFPIWWRGTLDMTWQATVALSAALAMSSTAIVAKLLAERAELQSEHGKRIMGVLLFQDIAVVPLLVLIPALAAPTQNLVQSLAIASLKGAALVTVLLVGGQMVMRTWLKIVARKKSEELFVLNILLITLGLAWLTEWAGLSLALGAFIAGMLISETEFKHQVEAEIRPFHDVLLGLFFITIGKLLDWRLVLAQWPLVLTLSLLPVIFKSALVAALALAFGSSKGVAMRTGLYLAQAGEFGFVLLTLASQEKLVPPELFNPILASMVISMLATPFIIMHSNWIVLKISSNEWLAQSLSLTQTVAQSFKVKDHVIVCGYGRSGQNLCAMLAAEKIPTLAIDVDRDLIEHAGFAIYGDATRPATLQAVGVHRALALVVTFIDTPAALRLLAWMREHAPKVPVIVRTIDDRDLEALQAAGAVEVVPDALESSLMLASHALAVVGVPMRRVIRIVQDQRNARYSLLRDYYDENKDGHH
ncbi:MAG: cation:proton antiporter [Cytophagales bacterium]|nr:cation:proton antiporter [Cytophagales bacterium]